jgi:hypothetical protein
MMIKELFVVELRRAIGKEVKQLAIVAKKNWILRQSWCQVLITQLPEHCLDMQIIRALIHP